MNNINDILASFRKNLDAMAEDFNERNKGLREAIQESNKWEEEYTYLLSNHGWYISGNMPITSVYEILKSLNNNKIKVAENILIKYYKSNIVNIKNRLLKKYPDRKKLISEAFKCHKSKMYFASTILILSQADGICDGNVFKKKASLNKFLQDKKSPSIVEAVLSKESAIDSYTGRKTNYFSELNRHEVMHGLYSDYGNEINSLKAISLFCFISDFVGRYK